MFHLFMQKNLPTGSHLQCLPKAVTAHIRCMETQT